MPCDQTVKQPTKYNQQEKSKLHKVTYVLMILVLREVVQGWLCVAFRVLYVFAKTSSIQEHTHDKALVIYIL